MKESPFSACIDESSDNGVQKINPLTIRIFDVNRGQVATQFLDMCMVSSSTAESIFQDERSPRNTLGYMG